MSQKIPELICPSGQFTFLLVQIGTNNTARNDNEQTKGDYKVLGRRMKEFQSTGVFISSPGGR